MLEHQLSALEQAGVHSTVIVVCYEQEQIPEAAGSRARFIVNERFAETNSLFS